LIAARSAYFGAERLSNRSGLRNTAVTRATVVLMLDSRRNILLACALSALAGYVDGIGFLHLGGLFVSFMSGNSTRMGVTGGARWGWAPNLLLWAALVAGSVCGALAYHWISLAAIWFAAGVALHRARSSQRRFICRLPEPSPLRFY
jgi:uncharacterized membrane protein YoaK (UPF0700 family)